MPQNVVLRIVCLRVLLMPDHALAEESLIGLFQKLRESYPAAPCEWVGWDGGCVRYCYSLLVEVLHLLT